VVTVAGLIAVAFAIVGYATGIAVWNAVTVAVLLAVGGAVAVGVGIIGVIVVTIGDAVAVAVVIRKRVRFAVVGFGTTAISIALDNHVIRAGAIRGNIAKFLAIGVVITAVFVGVFLKSGLRNGLRLTGRVFTVLVLTSVFPGVSAISAVRTKAYSERAAGGRCPFTVLSAHSS
jgi:hypothetical protein